MTMRNHKMFKNQTFSDPHIGEEAQDETVDEKLMAVEHI